MRFYHKVKFAGCCLQSELCSLVMQYLDDANISRVKGPSHPQLGSHPTSLEVCKEASSSDLQQIDPFPSLHIPLSPTLINRSRA